MELLAIANVLHRPGSHDTRVLQSVSGVCGRLCRFVVPIPIMGKSLTREGLKAP